MQAPATGASHVTPIAWTRSSGAALFSSRKRTTVTSHATATEPSQGARSEPARQRLAEGQAGEAEEQADRGEDVVVEARRGRRGRGEGGRPHEDHRGERGLAPPLGLHGRHEEADPGRARGDGEAQPPRGRQAGPPVHERRERPGQRDGEGKRRHGGGRVSWPRDRRDRPRGARGRRRHARQRGQARGRGGVAPAGPRDDAAARPRARGLGLRRARPPVVRGAAARRAGRVRASGHGDPGPGRRHLLAAGPWPGRAS